MSSLVRTNSSDCTAGIDAPSATSNASVVSSTTSGAVLVMSLMVVVSDTVISPLCDAMACAPPSPMFAPSGTTCSRVFPDSTRSARCEHCSAMISGEPIQAAGHRDVSRMDDFQVVAERQRVMANLAALTDRYRELNQEIS